MIETKEEIKQLYKDAVYIHLLREGYTIQQARSHVERVFSW
jgi:hypothetical protein